MNRFPPMKALGRGPQDGPAAVENKGEATRAFSDRVALLREVVAVDRTAVRENMGMAVEQSRDVKRIEGGG